MVYQFLKSDFYHPYEDNHNCPVAQVLKRNKIKFRGVSSFGLIDIMENCDSKTAINPTINGKNLGKEYSRYMYDAIKKEFENNSNTIATIEIE